MFNVAKTHQKCISAEKEILNARIPPNSPIPNLSHLGFNRPVINLWTKTHTTYYKEQAPFVAFLVDPQIPKWFLWMGFMDQDEKSTTKNQEQSRHMTP